MKNKPQNNPQKKVTKIVLVDAFTLREQIPCPFLPWTISIATLTKNKKEACNCKIKQNSKFS